MLSSNRLRVPAFQSAVAAVLVSLLVTACSGGSGGGVPTDSGSAVAPLVEDQAGSEPLPRVLELLGAETDLMASVPDIAFTRTTSNSGIQISYTSESLRSLAPTAVIETQWNEMQQCLQQTTVAPLVIVRPGLVEPFTVMDDVVRNEQITDTEITSAPVASASILHGPVIQISVTDFDGSLGTPLFNLRSIMGRHIWLSNNLPERDYPFACAREPS